MLKKTVTCDIKPKTFGACFVNTSIQVIIRNNVNSHKNNRGIIKLNK